MSLLSYNELIELIDAGVINADKANVNAASIDITLDDVVMFEKALSRDNLRYSVDISKKESISMEKATIHDDGYTLMPDDFILASSREIFNLPNNISAEYKLKSSMARNGLEHLTAGFCDAGWSNSRLTLEFKNMTKNHPLLLRKGMKIGQVVFFKHEEVPSHASYSETGRYNNQKMVTEGKGVS